MGRNLVLLLALLWTSDSCCPFLLLDLGPSVGGWATLFFFTRQHIQHRYSVLRTAPEARIAPVNIKLPRRVFNLTTPVLFLCLYLTTCVIHRQGPCTDPSLTYSNCIPAPKSSYHPIIPGRKYMLECASSLVRKLSQFTLLRMGTLHCGEQDKTSTKINILTPKAP